MPVGGTLALTTIIIAVSAGIIIRHRRGDGWRRIVAVAVLVWLGVAGLIVLWTLIAAVAGQRASLAPSRCPASSSAKQSWASRSGPLSCEKRAFRGRDGPQRS